MAKVQFIAGNTQYVRFLVALTPPDVPVCRKDSYFSH